VSAQFGRISIAALGMLSTVFLSTAASAGEDDGRLTRQNLRNATCDDLYTIRNGIFDRAGYCFKSDRARRLFHNRGCRFSTIGELPLSALDRDNISLLRALERSKGCD
jgi:hypothetical protein